MTKKFIPITLVLVFVCGLSAATMTMIEGSQGSIKRLTHSGNDVAKYPSMSNDGRKIIYTLELKESEEQAKAILFMDLDDGQTKELFRDGTIKAPAPYDKYDLCVGSKPPLLNANGKVAVFTMSIGKPINLEDHYLAVISTEKTRLWMTSFPISKLEGKDIKSLEFKGGDWERVANYAISADGNRIACLVKGHLGPRRYGSASGIILLDIPGQKQSTLLAPDFKDNEWIWTSFPRRPAAGGAWAFCMSGDGEKILFGAQFSENPNDYDLFIAEWTNRNIQRLTDFADRWFSLADISQNGEAIVFFYSGQKKEGIGTYRVQSDGTGLTYIESQTVPKIDFFDLSGDGRFLLYKNIYQGIRLDLISGQETLAYSEKTDGYITGLMPMDFPNYPSFWMPHIMNFSGDRILLVGPPPGKESPEIYLLSLDER